MALLQSRQPSSASPQLEDHRPPLALRNTQLKLHRCGISAPGNDGHYSADYPFTPTEQLDGHAHDLSPSHLDVSLKSPSDHAGCLLRRPLERDLSIWNHQCPASDCSSLPSGPGCLLERAPIPGCGNRQGAKRGKHLIRDHIDAISNVYQPGTAYAIHPSSSPRIASAAAPTIVRAQILVRWLCS